MAKKKNKLVSGYYDANTSTRVTDANIEEDNNGWRIVKNNQNTIAPAPSVNNNRNSSFVSSLMNTQNDVFSKVMTFQNQQPSILEEDNSLEGYKDTGKKYGDYYYENYGLFKDTPIFVKNNKYYVNTNGSYQELGNLDKNGNVITGNVMTSKEAEKQKLEEAKKLGYKDNSFKVTSQEYDDIQSSFKKLKKEYKLSDKELQDFIDNGNLTTKHIRIQDKNSDKIRRDAIESREKLASGKVKQYSDKGLRISDRIYMDTHEMSDNEKTKYINYITGKRQPEDENKSSFFKASDVWKDGYDFGDVTKTIVGTRLNPLYSMTKGMSNFVEGTSDALSNVVGTGLEKVGSVGNKKQDVTETKDGKSYIGYRYGNKNYWYDKKSDRMYDENWNELESFNLDTFQKRYTNTNKVAEFGRQMKEQAANDDTSEVMETIGKPIKKASILGDKSNAMFESLGQALPLMAAGNSAGGLLGEKAAVATTSALTFANTYGSAKTQAIRNGASETDAVKSAFIQAAAETISEQFFDSIPGAKSAGWGEKAVGKISSGVEKYFGTQTGKVVAKTLDISGEGFEEIISNMITAGGNDIFHAFDKNFNYGMEGQTGNIAKDMANAMLSQDSVDSFVCAIITSAILNGGSAKLNNAQMNNIVSTYAKENNISVNEARIKLDLDSNIEGEEKYSYSKKIPTVIKYEQTDNAKINNFRQSAVNEKMINSKKTQDFMNLVENVISDKNYNIIFDSTITNEKGTVVDGKISLNNSGEAEIRLNPQSDRAAEFLLTHEITHAIETKELRGLILDYANKNPQFKAALKDLQKTYGTTNVNDEVVADISGQVLGNQEFINSLSAQNTPQSRNIIKNIYESIKRVLNNFTSKGRYRNFVQDLETKWRYAYSSATNETSKENLSNDSKYVQKLLKDGTKYIETENGLFVDQDGKSLSQRQIFKSIVGKQIIFNDGIVATIKEWLPNNKNMYNELFKRYPKYQGVNNIKEVNNNINENSLELLENSDNISPNEPDYMGRHKANKIKNFDTRKVSLYDGKNAYDLTFSIAKMNDETYVAYAKKELVKNDRLLNKIKKEAPTSKSRGVLPSVNNIPQSNNNVKSDISTKYSMQSKENNTQELDNSSFSLKEKQLEIIKKENPMNDDYHTGIRTIDDIKTPEEAFKTKIDEDEDYIYPDFTKKDGEKALESGKITVYSSQEIKQGTFVSPSKSMAQDYAGNGKIFEQTININDVAWLDSNEGQYAKVDTQKPKIPIAKEYQKNTIDEKKSNKDEYIRIANTINESIKGNTIVGSEVKERSWIETPLESDVVKDKVLIEDLDPDKINYTVKSNKKTLKKANKKIDLMGYEESVKYIKSKLNDDNISLTDIVMGERIIQEAIKKGDKQLASDLITDIAILGTELGQKVQALSIIQRLTPEGQLKMFQKIVKRAKIRGEKSFQDVEITPEMVELILNAYDKNGNFNQDDLNNRVEQFKQEIADQLKTSTEEKIDAWRYLSMLGNPKTHIRNIVSNVAMKGTVAYKNALARTLETVLPIKNRTKTWKKTSEEVKQYAKQTAIEMKDTITGNNKFSEKGSIESKKRIFKNKFLESLSNFNSDMLELEDWFFSKSAFINSFQEYLTANGIMTKEDINNNSEIIEKGKNYAVEQAEIATFRQYSKLASEINRIERNNKVAKYPIKAMVPFKKTPINVAKTGVKYSPLGLIKNISYDVVQLKKGNIEASQFIDNLSQGVTGTSLMLIGYGLSKAGILLGSGDDDKEGKYDSLLGKTGYSIKIGNKYYSLSWLSPVAMPLFVGSNFHEQLEEKKGWDMNVVSDTLAKTLDPLSEMSFVSSLNDALSSYGSGTDKIFSMGESVAQSYVGQFFPTLFSQFSNTFDDTKRSTKASSNSSYKFGEQTLRSIMYKIPGLHNKLEPSVDVWGNELKQSDNVLTRAFESFIAPYSKRKDITSKLDKEIKRVYKEVGNDDVIPGVPRTDITYKKEKYRMSANEYTNYKKEYGESANTMLKMLINRDDYKDSADTRKTRMIKKVYDYSKEIAKTEFLEKRRIKFDEDDFKTSTMDYEDIVDYILRNTRYMDGE